MKLFIPMVLAFVVVLGGCTTASKNVAAVYVSPVEYSNYTCRQLLTESDRIKNHYYPLAARLDALATKDSVNGAVGVVVFFPLLFGVGGNEMLEVEYGQYKGELSALLMAATVKKCTNLAWAQAELKKISVME